jgi:hypothetical protein
MKHFLFWIGAWSMVLTGCATMGGGSGLPKQRPADLVITYNNGGGMLDEGEHYYISQDSCVRDSRFEGHQNRWVCKPDAKQLDALYAQLVKDDVATIKTEDQGEVYDRGGITLHFDYGGKSFEIVDAGSSFVVERDADRFRRTADGIVGLVGECIQRQAIAIAFDLRVETGDSAVQECRISLDNTIIVDWRAQNAEPLAHLRTLTLLPGRYELTASYQVGQKWFSIDWPLKLNATKPGFQLILKKDGFAVIEK